VRCSRRPQKSIKKLIKNKNKNKKRLANNGKMMTFAGVPLFDALMCSFSCVGLRKNLNKKFELMLTRRAKAYSSSGSAV